jgi:hypothetical protein
MAQREGKCMANNGIGKSSLCANANRAGLNDGLYTRVNCSTNFLQSQAVPSGLNSPSPWGEIVVFSRVGCEKQHPPFNVALPTTLTPSNTASGKVVGDSLRGSILEG